MTKQRFCEIHGKEFNAEGKCPSCLLAAAKIAANIDTSPSRLIISLGDRDGTAGNEAGGPSPTPAPTSSKSTLGDDAKQRAEAEAAEAARKDAAEAKFREQLTTLPDDIFAVMLIGNSTFGKTFVRKRLEKQLFPQYQTRSSRAATVGGQSVPLTDTMEMHHFEGENDKFVVFDMPGEYLENLVGRRAYAAASAVIDAMQRANALIVTLPANVALFGSDFSGYWQTAEANGNDLSAEVEFEAMLSKWLSEDPDATPNGQDAAISEVRDILNKHDNLDTFVKGIYELAVINSYITAHPQPRPVKNQFPIEALTIEAIDAFRDQRKTRGIGDVSTSTFPVAIALTKADRVLPFLGYQSSDTRIENRNGRIRKADVFKNLQAIFKRTDDFYRLAPIISDPRKLLQVKCSDVVQQFDIWMPNNRIELVSAFYDHPGNDNVDYKLPHIGVDSLIDWIFSCNRRTLQEQKTNPVIPVLNYWDPRKIDSHALVKARARRDAMEGKRKVRGPNIAPKKGGVTSTSSST